MENQCRGQKQRDKKLQFLGCMGTHAPARRGEEGGNGEENPRQSLKGKNKGPKEGNLA